MLKIQKQLTLIIFLFVLTVNVIAQAPRIEWQMIYGEQGKYEYGRGAYSTPDGGYVVGGTTRRDNTSDCLILKLNSEGNSVWSRATGSQTDDEHIEKFYILPNGYYIAAGSMKFIVDTLYTRALIMMITPDGFHEWSGYYGNDRITGYAADVAVDTDSSFIFTGPFADIEHNFSSDVMQMSVHYLGGPLWKYLDYEENAQTPKCIQPLMGGGYIIVGDGQDFVSYRAEGMIIMTNEIGLPTIKLDIGSEGYVRFSSVRQLPDSGFVIVGTISHDLNDPYDLIVTRRNKHLGEVWTKTYGLGGNDVGECVEMTPDGGFIVGGSSEVGSMNFWALRLDSNGDSLWSQIVGTPRYDYLRCLSITDDGGYIMCGETKEVSSFCYDILIVKLEPDILNSTDYEQLLPSQCVLYNNFPNPFNSTTKIKYSIPKSDLVQLKIFDVLGNEVKTLLTEYKQAGTFEVEFNANNLPSGIYFYRMISGSYSETKKMIFLK